MPPEVLLLSTQRILAEVEGRSSKRGRFARSPERLSFYWPLFLVARRLKCRSAVLTTDMQSFRMPLLQVRSAFDPTAAAYQQQQAIRAFQAEKNVPIDAQWLEWELEG